MFHPIFFSLAQISLILPLAVSVSYDINFIKRSSQQVSIVCTDNKDFEILINSAISRYEPCTWITDGGTDEEIKFRRREQCGAKLAVRTNCPYSCGLCPTKSPTKSPTANPTISNNPSVNPSSTNFPSNAPSIFYSEAPSLQTSNIPSVSLTNFASQYPSVQPVVDAVQTISSGELQNEDADKGEKEITNGMPTKYLLIILSSTFALVAFVVLFFVNKKANKKKEEPLEVVDTTSDERSSDEDHLLQTRWCDVWPISGDEVDTTAANLRNNSAFVRVHSTISEAASTMSNVFMNRCTTVTTKAHDEACMNESPIQFDQNQTGAHVYKAEA